MSRGKDIFNAEAKAKCIECGYVSNANFNKEIMTCIRCGKRQPVKDAVNYWYIHSDAEDDYIFTRKGNNNYSKTDQQTTSTGYTKSFERKEPSKTGKKKTWTRRLALVGAFLVVLIVAKVVSQQKHQEVENHIVMAAIEEQLNGHTDEKGYVTEENYALVLDKVYAIVENETTVSNVVKNEYCVYFEDMSGHGYVYVPQIEGYDAGGNDLRIVTMQPYYTENIEIDEDSVLHSCNHGALDQNAQAIAHNWGWEFKNNQSVSDDDVNDAEVTIERILSLDEYKIILWQGHGCYSEETGFYLMTNIYSTKKSRSDYKQYLNEKSMITTDMGTFALTEKFFDLHFEDGAFDNAVIYMGTCLSGYTESFADLLVSKGAAVVFVNSDTISREYNLNMIDAVMSGLNEEKTVSQALNDAQSIHGSENTVGLLWAKKTAHVYYKGQENAGQMTLRELTYKLNPDQAVQEMGMSVFSGIVCTAEDSWYLQMSQPMPIAITNGYNYQTDMICFDNQTIQKFNQKGIVAGTDIWVEGIVEQDLYDSNLRFLICEIIEFSLPGAIDDSIVEPPAEVESPTETIPEMTESTMNQVNYQEIYSDLLDHLLALCANPEDSYLNCYSIYDIGEDGIPELIVKSGDSESNSEYDIITIIDGEAYFVETLCASHCTLYGVPGNGLVSMAGHMGYETCGYITMNNGVVASGIYYSAEVQQYWDEICQVKSLPSYPLYDLTALEWEGNPTYDNWSALEPARARVFS